MVHAPTHTFFLSLTSEDAGWHDPYALALALAAIGLLLWQLANQRTRHRAELEEQSDLLVEEQEKSRAAQLAADALTRESQAKSEMLATLSREVRSHLNGIIGSADLLFDNSLKPRQRENLVTLRASAESLHQSLNDVLDYSAIETRQIKISNAPFDLRQPLIEVIEHISPLALLKGLELVLIVAPDVPLQVTGDATRLRQVLRNLTSNAVKFTAHGRVVLRAEIASGASNPSQHGGPWLHFTVSDTGEGIPEDMQATLFDRIVLSDATAPRKFGGSGLELAIGKRLVELLGGTIGARNLPESGSEFWVVLPLPATAAQPTLAAPQPGMHVVLVDDLAAARLASSAMLTRLGIEHDVTDAVGDAAGLLRDALESEATERVLLLDESVARAHAADVARLLTEDRAPVPPRIVLMAVDPDSAPAAGLAIAVTAVLRKPLLRPEALLDALRKKTLPRPSAAVVSADSRTETPPAAATKPRVLVVDDDEISRSVSSQLLALLGCDVERAESGPAAIALAEKTRFDLIFMDCQMPVMSGFVTTERIRAAHGAKAPPIVALTANTSPADRERCFAVGMCDFVDKPVRKAELARVVNHWTQAVRPTGPAK